MRIRDSAGLPPLEFDCLAFSKKQCNKKLIVFGGIKFQIREAMENLLFM